MSKSKTNSAANAFGAGSDLIGMSHKGHKIIDASRKYMHLDNGDKVSRAGNRVDHEPFIIKDEPNNTAYMTDDL